MPLTVDGQEFYTMREVCAVLGIKPATLYAYVSRGLLASYRQGNKRQRLYHKNEVDGMLTLVRGSRTARTPRYRPRRR